MSVPSELLYTEDHEWARVDGDAVVIGITDYAQDELGDVVYVELPLVGEKVEQGNPFGVVESVKAASDLFTPVSGEITETNDRLEDAPELVNSDPYGDGWMIKLAASNWESEKESLLEASAYEDLIS